MTVEIYYYEFRNVVGVIVGREQIELYNKAIKKCTEPSILGVEIHTFINPEIEPEDKDMELEEFVTGDYDDCVFLIFANNCVLKEHWIYVPGVNKIPGRKVDSKDLKYKTTLEQFKKALEKQY